MQEDFRIEPIISEKSTLVKEENKYVLKISARVNKIMLKKFIENNFKVKVLGVNIVNLPSKERRLGKSIGVKPGYKKAYVRIEAGKKIEAFEAV